MGNYNTIFLDMGHGGWNPQTKEYLTPARIGKKFEHKDKEHEFHNNGWFYEGVKNREYGYLIKSILDMAGVNVVVTSHLGLDTPLEQRVQIANQYHLGVSKGIFVSEHSNAHDSEARGFSVFSAVGSKIGNILGTELYEMYHKEFPEVQMRSWKQSHKTFPKNFTVLARTMMPAVLIENLFFDNFEDAKKLSETEYKKKYCRLVAEWCIKALHYMNTKSFPTR